MNKRTPTWRITAAMALLSALLTIPTIAVADEHDEVDERARVSWVDGVIDSDGQLWFKVGFYLPWDETPPRDVFSLFFSLAVTVGDQTKSVGWETHDGQETFLGDEGTQAFILDNGCVLIATGIYPDGSYDVQINATFASWQDEETTDVVQGSQGMGTSSEFVKEGDPFVLIGTPVFDLATGQPVDGNSPGRDSTTSSTMGESTSDDSAAETPGDSGSSSGGIDSGLALGLFVLATLIFLYWWFGVRPKRYAYRADREVGLDIVEGEPETTTDETLELEATNTEEGFPVMLGEPDTSFEDPCWEQSRTVDEAQNRLSELESERAETDSSHEETHRALDQAIEQAQENVAAAQKELDECVARHRGSTDAGGLAAATPTTPPPTSPAVGEEPKTFSKDCKEEEDAYAAAVAATDRAKERRDAAEAAWLEAAEDEKAEALAERDASVAAQDAAIDAENDARRALDACRRVSVDDSDDETGPGSVDSAGGVDSSTSTCEEGAEEWRYESQSRRFTVLDGEVRVRISNAPATWGAWQRANGSQTTVAAAALQGLDRGEMEALLAPLPGDRRVIPAIAIPTKRIRVRCERLYKCQGGVWIATDQMRKNPVEFKSPDERFGGRDISTVGNIVELIERVQKRLEELHDDLEEGRAFECGD